MNEDNRKFYRLWEVLEMIPVSKSTWWQGVKTGRYPASVKLGLRTTAWRREDIEALLQQLNGEAADAA